MKEESNNQNQELERESVSSADSSSSSVLARCYNSIWSLSTLDSHIDWAIKCHREGALNLAWIEKSARRASQREIERTWERESHVMSVCPRATSACLSTSFSHQLDKLWSPLGYNLSSELITNHLFIYYTILHAINNWGLPTDFYLYMHFISNFSVISSKFKHLILWHHAVLSHLISELW